MINALLSRLKAFSRPAASSQLPSSSFYSALHCYHECEHPATALRDLLTDATHWCNERGLDMQALVDAAQDVACEEIRPADALKCHGRN